MPAIKKDDMPRPMGAEDIHTILGPESSFEGKLVFNAGTVRIDGHFRGEVRTTNTLIVGETARVEGTIEAGNLIITGEVVGDVTAKRSVAIEKPAKVRGTVVTPELMIERGVIFEGTCKMEEASRGTGATVKLLPNVADTDKT